jgi:hypothetical protein
VCTSDASVMPAGLASGVHRAAEGTARMLDTANWTTTGHPSVSVTGDSAESTASILLYMKQCCPLQRVSFLHPYLNPNRLLF